MSFPNTRRMFGGLANILSGGTRTKVNRDNRPWQSPIGELINTDTCVYCRKDQEFEVASPDSDWRVIKNPFTPMPWHFLIIPRHCPDESYLTSLGGEQGLRAIFKIARTLLADYGYTGQIQLVIHIGRTAGQNAGHLHIHVMPALVDRPIMPRGSDYSIEHFIEMSGSLTIAADGLRAGQVMLAPSASMTFAEVEHDLAAGLAKMAARVGHVFRNQQGEVPHFMVVVRINDDDFLYATICPILNFWGGSELVAAMEQGAFTVLWPHELSAMLYRGETVP